VGRLQDGFWWLYMDDVNVGAYSSEIGMGLINTDLIISTFESNGGSPEFPLAAKIAREYNGGGYNDWFLPSKDELNMFYKFNHDRGEDLFGCTSSFWSSTEYEPTLGGVSSAAWAQNTTGDDGTQHLINKFTGLCVFPIRYF